MVRNRIDIVDFQESDIKRFFEKTRRDDDGCLIWEGNVTEHGVGRFTSGARQCSASRFAYAIQHETCPENVRITHACGNRLCVAADHLVARQVDGKKPVIRQLKDGEPIPDGVPKRYVNGSGYMRLRWLVGPNEYVEAYEHRLVKKCPQGLHVHHVNRVRDDNREENLKVLTPSEHEKIHANLSRERHARMRENRDGLRSWNSFKKHVRNQVRREQRMCKYRKMKELYERGYTTVQIGELFGMDPSNISIHLRQVGTSMRCGRSNSLKAVA